MSDHPPIIPLREPLEVRIESCMLRDRPKFRARVRNVERLHGEALRRALAEIGGDVEKSMARRAYREEHRPRPR